MNFVLVLAIVACQCVKSVNAAFDNVVNVTVEFSKFCFTGDKIIALPQSQIGQNQWRGKYHLIVC